MSLLELGTRVAVTILVLLVMARLSGPKQISQLSFYDYITGITVGSLAASTSTDSSLSLFNGLVSIVLFLAAGILMGKLSAKSETLRPFLTGKPIVLIEEGGIRWDGLKKSRLNMNELLSMLRYSGYFNVSDVNYAILEPTGKISVQPHGSSRPPKASELKVEVPELVRPIELVIGGVISYENLQKCGKEEAWLLQVLKSQNITDIRDVGLAVLDDKGNLTVHKLKK